MKKKLLLGLLAALFLCLFSIGVSTSFAEAQETFDSSEDIDINMPSEEPPAEEPNTSEESSSPAITDEQLEKLAELLKDKLVNNTGLTEDDVNSITSTISEWLGGKVSETVIVIIVCVVGIVIAIAAVLINKTVKLKSQNKQLNDLKLQYNNLFAQLETFNGNAVAGSVSSELKQALSEAKSSDTAYLAKIESICQALFALCSAQTKAMGAAWGNKVPGVNAVLSEAPTQGAVENLALYNKQLEEAVKAKYGAEADEVLADIKKKSGV